MTPSSPPVILHRVITVTNPQNPGPDAPTTEYQVPLRQQQAPTAMPDPDRNLPVPRQSHIISNILSPAVRLWLRSQVEHVEELHVLIEGGDRQLLSGLVPRVTISARDAVYQGLYITQVQLVGRGLKVNLKQVLRGKSLQLERVVPVQGEVVMVEEDLNASLQSPLLAVAISDLLTELLRAGAAPELIDPSSKKPIILDNFWAVLNPDSLTLGAEIVSVTQGTTTPFVIRTGLRIINGRELSLVHPEWLPTAKAKRGLALHDLDGFVLDLGTDVEIQDLILEEGQLTCRGRINVIPADAA